MRTAERVPIALGTHRAPDGRTDRHAQDRSKAELRNPVSLLRGRVPVRHGIVDAAHQPQRESVHVAARIMGHEIYEVVLAENPWMLVLVALDPGTHLHDEVPHNREESRRDGKGTPVTLGGFLDDRAPEEISEAPLVPMEDRNRWSEPLPGTSHVEHGRQGRRAFVELRDVHHPPSAA